MSRFLTRRLTGLEKQAATVLAATQYPPIPPLSECKGWTVKQHVDLYERVRRGEYSVSADDVESRPRIDPEGKTPQELANIYGQMRQETKEEVRRELATWRDTDFPKPSKPSSPR